MNSWVLIFLGGDVGDDLLIVGPFASEDAAIIAAISTGAPWNYQSCNVYGPAVPPPMGTLSPIPASVNSWLAVASGITPNGGVRPIGYGTFASKAAARTWASAQANPAGYSFGQVVASPS
jgi:hypothetical protein